MDCGAFTGDTIEKFIKFSGGNYSKIWGVEADPKNFALLENFIRQRGYKNVQLFNGGVWNERGQISFSGSNSTDSAISENGDITVPTEKIDNIVGGEEVSLIKMDIEGAELKALQGAAETIKKYAPTLAICIYHKPEDLITIPQYIKSLYGNYKFYLRHHSVSLNECVLYAIDKN